MRTVLLLLSVTASFLGAATRAANPLSVDEIMASLNPLKPDIRADILLQVASRNSYSSSQRQRLVEEAFAAADSAQNEYPEQVAAGSPSDSPAGLEAAVAQLGSSKYPSNPR